MKIHYHSDNPSWAASEQLLIVFLTNPIIKYELERQERLSFSYRETERYEEGMKRWFRKAIGKAWEYDVDSTIAIDGSGNPDPVSVYVEPNFIRMPLKFPITGIYRLPYPFRILKYSFFPYDMYVIYDALGEVAVPDIIHVNNGGYPGAISCNAAAVTGKTLGAKVVYMVNAIEDRPFWKRTLEFWMDRLVAKSVDAFVTASEENGERLRKILKVREDKVRVIPNTIHHHRDQIHPKLLRQRLRIGDDDILITTVGVFEERKGTRYILDAFKRLEGRFERSKGVFLVMVGSGSLEPEFRRIAGNSERIKFIDDDYNAYSYIRACDIYAYHPVHSEDFSLTMLMAMRCGKPIVASAVAGNNDMIDHGENGLLVTPCQTQIFANSMEHLINNQDARAMMGEKSGWRYSRFYSEDIIMGRYVSLYKELLGRQ